MGMYLLQISCKVLPKLQDLESELPFLKSMVKRMKGTGSNG